MEIHKRRIARTDNTDSPRGTSPVHSKIKSAEGRGSDLRWRKAMCAMHGHSISGCGRTCTRDECRSETQNDVCALSARYLPVAAQESVIVVDNKKLPHAGDPGEQTLVGISFSLYIALLGCNGEEDMISFSLFLFLSLFHYIGRCVCKPNTGCCCCCSPVALRSCSPLSGAQLRDVSSFETRLDRRRIRDRVLHIRCVTRTPTRH